MGCVMSPLVLAEIASELLLLNLQCSGNVLAYNLLSDFTALYPRIQRAIVNIVNETLGVREAPPL